MRNVYVAVLTIAMWSGLLASPTGLYVPGPPSTAIPRFRARSTSDLAHYCEDGGISPGAPYDFGGASLLPSPIPNPPVAWQGCLQAPERLYFASMGHDASTARSHAIDQGLYRGDWCQPQGLEQLFQKAHNHLDRPGIAQKSLPQIRVSLSHLMAFGNAIFCIVQGETKNGFTLGNCGRP